MNKGPHIKSFVFFQRTGCLLPLLIILNFLFGWLVFKPLHWLITEAILILIFIINGYVITRKIASVSRKHTDAVDVEGEIVEEKSQDKTVNQKRLTNE